MVVAIGWIFWLAWILLLIIVIRLKDFSLATALKLLCLALLGIAVFGNLLRVLHLGG